MSKEKILKSQKMEMQHHHAIFKIKAESFNTCKELVVECQKLINAKIAGNGPMSWDASFDKKNNIIYIDGLFKNQEAVTFHQNNIKTIVGKAMPLLDGPPQTIVSEVFSFID